MRREPTFDPVAFEDDADVRPLGPPRPFARLRLGGRFVVAAAFVAALTVVAKDRMATPPEPRAWSEPPRQALAPRAAAASAASAPLLAVESTEGDPPVRTDPPRWNPATGLREDALTGGGFDAIESPFLRLALVETAGDGTPSSSLFVTLARRAAEMQGLSVLRTGLRGQVATKFGLVETVEATLSGQGRRACTGFRSLETRAIRLEGWLCGVLGQAPEAREIACLIDRVTLSGLSASTIEAVFAEAEAKRGTGCREPDLAGSPHRRADATGSIAAPAGVTRKNVARSRQKLQAWQ